MEPMLQYIAEMLLKLNERGNWSDPPPADADKRARQDEEIFQTARLIKYCSLAVSSARLTLTSMPLQLRTLYGDDLR